MIGCRSVWGVLLVAALAAGTSMAASQVDGTFVVGGTDAKLRVFKYERWIPAKWMELHQIYLRSCELSCDRQPMALPAAGAGGYGLETSFRACVAEVHPDGVSAG